MFLGTKFPVDLETWSRGFHRVVRWVKLQTNTRGRARSIALACRYGVKVFLGPDGAFGGNPACFPAGKHPEKPRTLVRGVVTKPDLLIYLRASLPTLRERIKKRGRSFEQNLPDRYLLGLNALYEQLIASWDLSPVYVVEADRIDFVEKAEDRDSLLAALRLWIQP